MRTLEQLDLIQTGTAARILGISPTAVQLLERTGKLPAALKTDRGTRLFLRADVEQLARERATLAGR
jgi:DNA-binding transcriptional MerR regulator